MRTISLHVPDDAYAELKAFAARRKEPVAALIRQAMEAWLEQHRQDSESLLDFPALPGRPRELTWSRAELWDEMTER
jgi:hypothetical protein